LRRIEAEDAMTKLTMTKLTMTKLTAAALAAVLVLPGAAAPAAAYDCTPYCDFTHDYGPYDFTYVRPGLFLYPRCGPSGNCSPHLVSTGTRYRGSVTIRPLVRRTVPRP
jgi:hypothetical protein